MGIVLFCNVAVRSVGGIVVTTLLLGFFSGVFVALPPAIFVTLTRDKSKLGTRIGMGLAMAGLSLLAGGPGGGRILGNVAGRLNWTGIWSYAGITGLSGGVIFLALRTWKAGFTMMVKV